MIYTDRTYRGKIVNRRLLSFEVRVRETDLFVSADTDLSEDALQSVCRHRAHLESYIAVHPEFLTSLTPVRTDDLAPPIVREMMRASKAAGVGPMAAVAGAIAQQVGRDLLSLTPNVIVENGGDIFLKSVDEIVVGVFAGESPLSNRIALRVRPEEMPLGVCTSSATVGPSLSFGSADAVCVKSRSASYADAAATAIGNLVKTKKDIRKALSFGSRLEDVLGVMVILEGELGVWGQMELA